MILKDARQVWNAINSIICVYKPSGVSTRRVQSTIINAIVTGLNEMECRPPIDYVSIEGNPSEQLTVNVRPNYADHTLVVGPRYQNDDLPCSWSNYLGHDTSGVLLLGLRRGTSIAKYIRENRPTRSYRVSGKLGETTENCFAGEQVVERSTWKHVRSENMSRLLSAMQASHQKQMFKLCGVDLHSDAAYQLAVQGPIRPGSSKLPVVYGIKCVRFEPPNFTIELQCINEYEMYLKVLIRDIGMQLHSTAHCTGIQCIRHSHFTLDNALLRKHWTLQGLFTNLEECKLILEKNDRIVRQKSAALQ